jgi:predicted Zn-dependent peptidase
MATLASALARPRAALLLALALLLVAGVAPAAQAQSRAATLRLPDGRSDGSSAMAQGWQPFTRDVLPNGLVVLVEERPGSGLVALEVAVLAGARFEEQRSASAAQFLEHLFLDGTSTRPTRRDVVRAITARGGDLSVSAGWERVRLAAEVASEDFDVALDVLSDMLLRSTFARDRFEAARARILQDLAERQDTPSDFWVDVARANALGDPALRHLPAGSPRTVRALAYDDLVRYRASHVTTGNTIVAVAGDVRRADVLPRIERAFASLPQGPRERPTRLPAPRARGPIDRTAGSEQANVGIAVRTPGIAAEDRAALVVLSGILGGGAQRLYQEIRDRRGLAYAVGSPLLQLTDAGVLTAFAGTEPANAAQVVELLRGELLRLRDTPPSEAEVARSIAYFVDGQTVDLETSAARAEDLTRREALYDVAPPREQFRQRLRAVRPADVQAAARRYLAPDQLITVVLRPQRE